MRQASRRGGKRRRAADRLDIGRIEDRVAARAVECLMGQLAELIDEETDLSDVNEVARSGLRRNMQLAVDQPDQQGFITRLFGPAASRLGRRGPAADCVGVDITAGVARGDGHDGGATGLL